jgi:hypothetical protein
MISLMVHRVTAGFERLDKTLRLRLYSIDVRVTEELEMIWN